MRRRHLMGGVLTLDALWPATPEPETLWLKQNGWMPNNERLPVLLYRAVFVSV